jgi:hypothetical protein
LRGAAGDEAISIGGALDGPRLLRFARNDSVYRINSFIQGAIDGFITCGSATPAAN